MQGLRAIHRFWLALLFLAIVVQIGAAGYGAFYAAKKSDPGPLTKLEFDHGFSFHAGFGYFVFLGGVVLLLLALAARLGKRLVLMNLGLGLLLTLQIVLAWIGASTPAVGTLHSINAFLILGLAGSLAHKAWWGTRTPAV
ncbi:MAG: hypothetical protein M3R26_01750 [Actinomycetota bacterium]|nr:hypothetical protein [Actinomycetota bacterium]MDQ2981035.1 hypothetical protein [Actinomycetota bacterium]